MPTYFLSTNRQSAQEDPFILQLRNGTILSLWSDLHPDPGAGGSYGVYGRVHTADLRQGAAADSRINTLTDDIQISPLATSFDNGGFAVIFQSRGPSAINGHDDAYYDSYIRFFAPDGSSMGPARQLTPNSTDDHYAADIVTLSNGQSVTLVARYGGAGNYDLLAYRHGLGGTQIGPPVQLVDNAGVYVNSMTGADYIAPSLAAGANGTYAVTWHERTSQGGLDGYAVWMQVHRADGSPMGAARVVAPVVPSAAQRFGLGQSDAAITGLTTGRWAVAWDREEPNSLENDVWFRLMNANGTGATGAVLVNSDRRSGNQALQDVVDLGAGQSLVTYFHYIDNAIDGLFDGGLLMGRVFGPSGQALTGSFQVSEGSFHLEMTGGNALINGAGQLVASFQAELAYAYDTDVFGVVRPLVLPAVHGGAGNDRIQGTFVNDVIHGQGGKDILFGNRGNDRLYGDAGDDTLSGGDGHDRLFGGAGNDMLWGDAGNDVIEGGDGHNSVNAGIGQDTVRTGAGSDSINGGAGDDNLASGAGGDRIFGLQGNDTIDTGAGHDILIGGAGNDLLRGGAGNDDLAAQAGADTLDGGPGNDLLRGGPGVDLFIFNDGADTIRNFDRTQDRIDLRSFAGLDGWGDVQDRLRQEGGHVTFRHGDDVLRIEWAQLVDLNSDDFIW